MPDYVPATVTVYENNDRVTVTKYTFPPMGETGWHTHGHAYVVVPTIGGVLNKVDAEGNLEPYDVVAGVAYYRESGVSHNVVNLSDSVVEFVETEIK